MLQALSRTFRTRFTRSEISIVGMPEKKCGPRQYSVAARERRRPRTNYETVATVFTGAGSASGSLGMTIQHTM